MLTSEQHQSCLTAWARVTADLAPSPLARPTTNFLTVSILLNAGSWWPTDAGTCPSHAGVHQVAGPGCYPVHEVGTAHWEDAHIFTLVLALLDVGYFTVQAEVSSLVAAALLDEAIAGVDVGPCTGRDVSIDRGAVHQTVLAEIMAELVAGGAIMAEKDTAHVMKAPRLALFGIDPVILAYDGGGVNRTLRDGKVRTLIFIWDRTPPISGAISFIAISNIAKSTNAMSTTTKSKSKSISLIVSA